MDAPSVPGLSRRRKLLVSLFILFHLFCVATWLLPASWPLRHSLLGIPFPLFPQAGGRRVPPKHDLVTTYIRTTGQVQAWSMFAPNPLNANRFIAADLVFERGNRKEFVFPRLSELGVWDSWLEKRWRKLAQRLMQIQVGVIYLTTALMKVSGETYREGTAMYGVLGLIDFNVRGMEQLMNYPRSIDR